MQNRGCESEEKFAWGLFFPNVLYRAETWDLKEVKRSRFNAFQIKYLKSLAGLTQRARIRNGNVRM